MSPKNLNAAIKIPNILKKNLKNQKISKIYKRFERNLDIYENFVVAVSGGPDSLALAFLAKIYSIKKNLVSKFIIVDHKLRSGSTNEAKATQKVLKKNSINSKILSWHGKKPNKKVQSEARKKRYQLLFAESDKFKIHNILLGHHRDDLYENFFIRLLRGSGLKGLISLDKKSEINGKILLRPLIDQKKEDLAFVAKYVFNSYIDDPSNKNEEFQRIGIRELIKKLQKKGLDKKKFHNTINNLKYSDSVVSFYVKMNLKENTFFSEKKEKIYLRKEYFEQPYEVVFRSLIESIKIVGKKHYPVRGKKLSKIISNLENSRLFKQTIGGCIIERVNQTVMVSKEH